MSSQSSWVERVMQSAQPPDARRLNELRATIALAAALVVAFLVPPSDRSAELLAAAGVLVGHLLAAVHWNWVGPLLGRGLRRAASIAGGGVAAALWALLLVEPMQRLLQRSLLAVTLGTVWEGMVAGAVWSLVPLLAVTLAFGLHIAWRAGAHAVLEGRIVPRAVHDTAWVAAVVGLAMAVALVVRQLNPLLSTDGVPWWSTAAGNLSVFIEAHAAKLITTVGAYAASQFLLAWRAGAPAPTCGTLVVLDLRLPLRASPGEARRLMRLATAWADRRGPVVLVRPMAAAADGAGVHAYWAHAAGRLETLFVEDTLTAHRWAAAWCTGPDPRRTGRGSDDRGAGTQPIALRECYTQQRALPELVSAIAAVERNAIFLLLVAEPDAPVVALDGTWLASLRDVLPKRRSMVLLAPPTVDDGRAPAAQRGIARLGTLQGRVDTRRALGALIAALEREFHAPPPQWRIALVGRPRTDASADRLVASLDQRKHRNGALVDAMRPLRSGGGGGCETAILLLDAAWLGGDPEAMAEAARLAPAVTGARSVYALVEGKATAEEVKRAAAYAGWTGELLFLGALPRSSDPGIDAAVALIAQRFIEGETIPPATLLVQRESPVPAAAAGGFAADGDPPEQSAVDPLRSANRHVPYPETPADGASRAVQVEPHVGALVDDVLGLRASPVVSTRESEARLLESLHTELIGARARLDQPAAGDDDVLRCEADTLRPSAQALRLFHRRGNAMVVRPIWPGSAEAVDPGGVVFVGADRLRSVVADACSPRRLHLQAPGQSDVDAATGLWRSMQRASVAIVDLSEADPQACYLLGQACALGTQLLLLAREGSAVPFAEEQPTLGYRDADDLAAQLPAVLDATLYGVQIHGSQPMFGTLQRCRDLAEQAVGPNRAAALLSPLEATVSEPMEFHAALERFLGQMGNSRLMLLHPRWPAHYPARDERRWFVVRPYSTSVAAAQSAYRGIEQELSAAGIEAVYGDEVASRPQIAASIWEETARASHVLVDLTGYKPNVCLALGMADAIGRDTLLIGVQGTSDRAFAAIDKRRIYHYGGDASRDAVASAVRAFAQRTATPR